MSVMQAAYAQELSLQIVHAAMLHMHCSWQAIALVSQCAHCDVALPHTLDNCLDIGQLPWLGIAPVSQYLLWCLLVQAILDAPSSIPPEQATPLTELSNGQQGRGLFDHVVIASGFFASAHEPSIPGKETFPGPIIHSSMYRSSQAFIGGSAKRRQCPLWTHSS